MSDFSYADNYLSKEDETKEYNILNPYDPLAALESIKNLIIDDFLFFPNDFKKNHEFDYFSKNSIKTISVNSLSIACRQYHEELGNLENVYYKTVDLNKYLDESKNIEFIHSQEKNEIILKMKVDTNTFFEELDEKFFKISGFESTKILKKKLEKNWEIIKNECFDKCKQTKDAIFEMKFNIKNILNVIYKNENGKLEGVINLNHPPEYCSNFLKLPGEEDQYQESQRTLFPFRDFSEPFRNLKFRNFSIIFEMDEFNDSPGSAERNKDILDNIMREKEKEANRIRKYTVKDHTNQDIISFFNSKEIRADMKEDNLYKFFYNLFIIISQGIASYYTIFDYLEEVRKTGLKTLVSFDFKPLIFIQSLETLINKHIYRNELHLSNLKSLIKEYYEVLYKTDSTNLKSSENDFLLIQRIVITPTCYYVFPNSKDPGNRVVRQYLDSVEDALRIVFKNDGVGDSKVRWTNILFTEFLKFTLKNGITLKNKHFKFFCYSQSQFRNLSCWLVTDPEKILEKCGEIKEKTVSKYGARLGQCLTTTTKTIPMNGYNILKEKDVEENGFKFSDGVAPMSADIGMKIAESLGLDRVPSSFQGRFLGCKGVWTVMGEDFEMKTIVLRDSQRKFEKMPTKEDYFEVCDYAKFNKLFLNRQVILLLNTLGVKDEVFIKKQDKFINQCKDNEFILSLVNYDYFRKIFLKMNKYGINYKNDRLISAVINSNKNILHRELKDRARIYEEGGACLQGIMDEYGILEYGEAFCKIKNQNSEFILNDKYAVTKCPCLHPGDIRKLHFKKYDQLKENTKKYQKLEIFENVIVFPKKGKRPHPNEIAGSDLDGDMYFIMYDKELCEFEEFEPMDYNSVAGKAKEVEGKITFDHIIEYFAEYENYNNLGLIANAHLAKSVYSFEGAKDSDCIELALKFAKAVDAPKTGVVVKLDEKERTKTKPAFMMDKKKRFANNSKNQCNHVLQKLYEKSLIEQNITQKFPINEFTDNHFRMDSKEYEPFIFEAFYLYLNYFKEINDLLIKNEIKKESELLTGNNDEFTSFQNKKRNYDILETIEKQLINIIKTSQERFQNTIINIFKLDPIYMNSLKRYNIQRALAGYNISYNIAFETKQWLTKENILLMKEQFEEKLKQGFEDETSSIDLDYNQYKNGIEDPFNSEKCLIKYQDDSEFDMNSKFEKIVLKLTLMAKEIEKNKFPSAIEEENQERVLSYPWVTFGDLLINYKVQMLRNINN